MNEKKGWSQIEFGALIKINTPVISRIENEKKKLIVSKLKLFETDYEKLKDLYFADKFVK